MENDLQLIRYSMGLRHIISDSFVENDLQLIRYSIGLRHPVPPFPVSVFGIYVYHPFL